MSICQHFKEKLENIKKSYLQELEEGLEEVKKTGNSQKLNEVYQKTKDFEKIINQLREEYFEKAKELISSWYPEKVKESKESFLNKLEITDDFKIIAKSDVNFRRSEISYFPSTITIIEGKADFTVTKLSELDALEEAGMLILQDAKLFNSAKNLKELKQGLNILNTDIKNFREAFPQLKKIGKFIEYYDRRGYHRGKYRRVLSNSSLLSFPQIKFQVEELREQGKIKVKGELKTPKDLEL